MSTSEFTVRVESDDQFAELAIVDSRYKVRYRGVGTLECKLPRGLYTVRARSGETTRQEHVRVTDADQTITFPVFGTLQSSAPVAPEQGFKIDMEIGSAQATTPNANSWICLALRHPVTSTEETTNTPRFLPVLNANGYALCTIDGTPIQSFKAIKLTPTPSDHWVAVLRLATGWYSLAMPSGGNGRWLMPLYVGKDFSPSVFVELRARVNGELRPDVDRLLVSYDGSEADIFRDRDRMRAMELARRSLARGRNMLTSALMDLLFKQKFSDPMLGLFAAHLLLLNGKNEQENFGTVVRNTGNTLGYHEHPDLVILRALGSKRGWWLNHPSFPGDDKPLTGPPLLRASWDGLLTLKDRTLEFKSTTSQLGIVARSLVKLNAWVLWRAPLAESQIVTMTNTQLSVSRAALRETVRDNMNAESLQSLPRRGPMSTDVMLRGLVDHVRSNPQFAAAIGERLGSGWVGGTNLERTIANAALQLTQSELDHVIPQGYAKRLAQSVGVPLPVLAEGIASVFGTLSDQGGLASFGTVPIPKN